MRATRQWSVTLCLVPVAILLGETGPIQHAATLLDRYREPLTWLAGGLLALGVASLLTGMVVLQVLPGVPMTRRDMEQVAVRVTTGARGYGWARIWGPFRGVKAIDAFSVGDLKAAWRSPTLIRDAAWQRRMASFIGMLLTIYASFTLVFVLARPVSVKLLIGAFVIGSLTQLARLIYRS